MKRRNILSLLKFVELLVNARVAYNNVKNDEEAKKIVNAFGRKSLVYFVVFLGIATVAVALMVWSITHFLSQFVFLAIGGIILALYLSIYALGFYILSFNLAIKQKRLNNKFCGILALILNILVLVAVLGAILALVIIKS